MNDFHTMARILGAIRSCEGRPFQPWQMVLDAYRFPLPRSASAN